MMTKTETPFGLNWRHDLFAFQQAGIARLVAGSALLADDMGLGKTIQAIGALRVLGHEAVPALLVAPASLEHHPIGLPIRSDKDDRENKTLERVR